MSKTNEKVAEDKDFFRNTTAVISEQGIPIDTGSLWQFNEDLNLLVLVDDDEHQTHLLTPDFVAAD